MPGATTWTRTRIKKKLENFLMGLCASKGEDTVGDEGQDDATVTDTEESAKEPSWATSKDPSAPKLKVKQND